MLVLKRSYFIGQKSKVDFSLVAARRTETRKGRAGQTSVTETATCQCPLRCRCFNSRLCGGEKSQVRQRRQCPRSNCGPTLQPPDKPVLQPGRRHGSTRLHTAPPQSVHAQSSSGLDPSVTDRGHFFSLLSWCFPSTETIEGRGTEPRTAPTTFTDTIPELL